MTDGLPAHSLHTRSSDADIAKELEKRGIKLFVQGGYDYSGSMRLEIDGVVVYDSSPTGEHLTEPGDFNSWLELNPPPKEVHIDHGAQEDFSAIPDGPDTSIGTQYSEPAHSVDPFRPGDGGQAEDRSPQANIYRPGD